MSKRIALLVIVATLWMASPAVAAAPTVALGSSPLEVAPGQSAALSVAATDVQDVYGLELHLRFDPAVVQVVDANPDSDGIQVAAGDFLSADFVAQNQADNQSGSIDYAVTQVNPSEPRSGSGTLLVIQFQGSAAGRASPLEVTDGILTTRDGELIAVTFAKGEVRVSGAPSVGNEAPATLTPQPPAPPPLTPLPPTVASGNTVPQATEAPGATPVIKAVATLTEATGSSSTAQESAPVVVSPTSAAPADGEGGASSAPTTSASAGQQQAVPPAATPALGLPTSALVAKALVGEADKAIVGREAPRRLVAVEPASVNQGRAFPWLLVGAGALLSLAGGLAFFVWQSARRGRA